MQKSFLQSVAVAALSCALASTAVAQTAPPTPADPPAPPGSPAAEAPPAPAPAPEPTSAPSAPATTTQAASAPAAGATAEVVAKPDEPVRFKGFTLGVSIYDGTGLSAVRYSNTLDFYFSPGWDIGRAYFKGTRFERFGISVRFPLSVPISTYDEPYFAPNSDGGPLGTCGNLSISSSGVLDPNSVPRCSSGQRPYQAVPGNTWFSIRNGKIATIPVLDIDINPGIRLILPTSREAIHETLILGAGASIGLTRSFLSKKINVGYSLGFNKNFHSSKTPVNLGGNGLVGDTFTPGYAFGDIGTVSNSSYFQNTTLSNVDWGLSHIFSVDFAPTEKLGITVLYLLNHAKDYAFDCNATYGNVTSNVCDNSQSTASNNGPYTVTNGAWRIPGQIFWLTVGYQALDWLNVSAALITATAIRQQDGSWRQPFIYWDPSGFSTVSVGATISLEKAAARLF